MTGSRIGGCLAPSELPLRSFHDSPTDSMTAFVEQPAMHLTKILPLFPSPMLKEFLASSCIGHRALNPLPFRCVFSNRERASSMRMWLESFPDFCEQRSVAPEA